MATAKPVKKAAKKAAPKAAAEKTGSATLPAEFFGIEPNIPVMHQVVNHLPLGRSVDETLRMVDALQHVENHGEVCPANWKKGDKGMDASPAGVAKYLSENADKL